MIQQLERKADTQAQIKGEVRLQILEQTFEAKATAAKRCSEEAGAALREIRENRLYTLAGFQSFEGYCQQRWGFNRRYGDRLIEMANTCDALRADESGRTHVLPESEWQQRPMKGLPPEEKRAVWVEAEALAGEGNTPTYAHVNEAVQRRKPVAEPPKPKLPANADTLGAELAALEEREILLEHAIRDVLRVWDARIDTQESPAEWDSRMDRLIERLRELAE